MKKLQFFILSALIFMSLDQIAQTDTTKKGNQLIWHTDINKANEISKATKKPIFAFFTGSDWCGWCKKLQNVALTKPEFATWAEKNVVLLELDFPRGKVQSPEIMQQNNSLQQAFQVKGYPTIWVFYLNQNAAGTGYDIDALGSLGYPQGAEQGKEIVKFLEDATAVMKKGTK